MFRIARTLTLLALLAVIFALPALAQRKVTPRAKVTTTSSERLVVRVVDMLVDEKIARLVDENRSLSIKVKINVQLPEGAICDELIDELITFNANSSASQKIAASSVPSLSAFKPGQALDQLITYTINLKKGEALDKITFSVRLSARKGTQKLTQTAQLQKIIAE